MVKWLTLNAEGLRICRPSSEAPQLLSEWLPLLGTPWSSSAEIPWLGNACHNPRNRRRPQEIHLKNGSKFDNQKGIGTVVSSNWELHAGDGNVQIGKILFGGRSRLSGPYRNYGQSPQNQDTTYYNCLTKKVANIIATYWFFFFHLIYVFKA